QSMRSFRLRRIPDGQLLWTTDLDDPTSFPLTAVPEPRAWVRLRLAQSELGQFRLSGESLFIIPMSVMSVGDDSLAVGAQAAALEPENGIVNARWARDPALRPTVSVTPLATSQRPSAGTAGA